MKTTNIIVIFVCSLLFYLPFVSYAVVWDFNSKAQEADWSIITGTCGIEDDAFKLSEPAAEALAITGESDWTDYTITCKARLTQPGGFNNIAIAFRAADDGSSEYMLMLEGGRQQAEWWKKIAGTYTELQVDPLAIDTKGWFSMKVVVKGKTFEGYYNEEMVSSIENSELDRGKVGVRIYGCTAHIDDYDVNGPGIPATSVEKSGKLATTWGRIRD